MTLLSIGLSLFPLNLGCSSRCPTSPSVRITIKVVNRLMQYSDLVECDRYLKLDGDLSEILGLQTNVTVLKVKVKVRLWNVGG